MSKPWPKPGMREANKLILWVDGIPKPQGSKSIGPNGHMYEANRGWKPWRDKLISALTMEGKHLPDGPVLVSLVFYFPKPQKPKFGSVLQAVTPDVDKCSRTVLDALESSGVVLNDSRVSALMATKCYADEWPGVTIHARLMAEWEAETVRNRWST